MSKKHKSTYDEFVEDPEQRKLLENEYNELLASELLLAVMEKDVVSVRELAQGGDDLCSDVKG